MTLTNLVPIVQKMNAVTGMATWIPVALYTVDRELEPMSREVILETHSDARFAEDEPSCWEPKDTPEQDRLWIGGERNDGPNCAEWDYANADPFTDYLGPLFVMVKRLTKLNENGDSEVVAELYLEATGWQHYAKKADDDIKKMLSEMRQDNR